MKSKIIKFLIIIVITVLVVIVGIELLNNRKPESAPKANNEILENTDTDNADTKDSINNKLIETSLYYWQNPEEGLEEYIADGMQGGKVDFGENETIIIDAGNGNWHTGDYQIEEDIIICNINSNNSAWHSEPEKLKDPVEVKLKYSKADNTLEVISISKPTLTIHTIDMVTGELMDDTKEYSLVQLEVGNIYSSENKYEE